MSRPPLTTYLKLCTEFYDLELEHNEATALQFYMQYAREAQGPILEPMCGTGRFLIPMLHAGLDIEGFDASPYMLDALRQKQAALSDQEAPVWQQFVQDFSSKKWYALIFVPFGSWGLITERESSHRALQSMYENLAAGGKLVLEIETVASLPQPCGIERRGVHRRSDGSKIALTTLTSYDQQAQIFKSLCRYESIVDGVVEAVELEDFQQYLYRFDEMDELLRGVGFRDIKKYCNYAKGLAVDPLSGNLIYECRK